MTADAIIFIDGNNLYHNVLSMGVRPGNVDFKRFVDYACMKLRCRWTRAIYYNSVPDITDGDDVYYGHMKFLSEMRKIPGFEVKTRKLQKQSNEKRVFEKMREIDARTFCSKCIPLVKEMCHECLRPNIKKEKGVDVMMAIDMLDLCAIKNECEMVVLISGDGDFVPALDIIKRKGKEAASAFIRHGYSNALRQSHRYWTIYDEDFIHNCLKENATT